VVRGKVTGIKETMDHVRTEIILRNNAIKKAKLEELVVKLKKATPVDTGNARDSWQVSDGKIVNDVPYMEQLNAGSSDQAPARFIEATLLSDPQVRPAGIIVKNTP